MADGQPLVVPANPPDQLGQLAAQVGGFGAYPAIMRSQMVADAIRQMQANPPTLRTQGSLWSNLAANAILQFARNRQFNKELGAVQQGVASYANAGAATMNGGTPSPPTPNSPQIAPNNAAGGLPPTPAPAGFAQGGAPQSQPATQPAPAATGDAFNKFLGFWAPHEGPPGHRDVDGGTDYYGLDTKSNPDLAANPPHSLAEAAPYLEQRVWEASGAPQIAQTDPALAIIHADTYGMGHGVANQALQLAGGDVNKYIALRQAGLDALVAHNPAKFGPVQRGWTNRTNQLLSYVQGLGTPGAGGPQGGPGQPGTPQPTQVAQNAPPPAGAPPAQPQGQSVQGGPTPLDMARAALGPTPGERQIIQQGLQAPPGSAMYMQAIQMEYAIRDRMAQMPKLPDGQYWDTATGQPRSTTQYADVPGAPNAYTQRNTATNQITTTPNSAYGPLGQGQYMPPTGGPPQPQPGGPARPSVYGQPSPAGGPPAVVTLPGAGNHQLVTPQERAAAGISPIDHGGYSLDPKGVLVPGAPAAVPPTEISQRQQAFTTSDAYKDYNQVRTSLVGLENAIQAAGGQPNNVLGATALTTLLQSWGVQNPRAANAEQVMQSSGLGEKAATMLLQGVRQGGMPMSAMMNVLAEAQAQAAAREAAAAQYVQGDVNAVRARDPSMAGYLGESIPPLPTFGQQGQGAPQGQGDALAAKAARMGLRPLVVNGVRTWVK